MGEAERKRLKKHRGENRSKKENEKKKKKKKRTEQKMITGMKPECLFPALVSN